MRQMKSKLLISVLAGILIVSACKKENGVETPDPAPVAVTDKIKDTVLLYSKDIYLWNSQIPSTFNPRTYGDPDKIMTALRTYSQEAGFTQPVDRWSFAVKR